MAPHNSQSPLRRVGISDVQRWLRDAWPDRNDYPKDMHCDVLAHKVNAIVDRHNARPKRAAAEAAIKKRRKDHVTSGRHARALQKSLATVLEHLQDEMTISTIEGLPLLNDNLSHKIAVIEQAQSALESFLSLPPPPVPVDHEDRIVWIEKAARSAWASHLSNRQDNCEGVRFGKKPDSPVVFFIQQALEAIGLTPEGADEVKLETISDHLRERHNRPRPARKRQDREGAK